MADLNRDSSAVCPFFLRSKMHDNRQISIICEGPVPNTEFTTTFKRWADADAHRARYCERHDNYMHCPCAKVANVKYEEAEDEQV